MRLQIRYTGRVQGVGFRATAHAAAGSWPVTGWVRNEFDGSVLMEIQGAPEALEGVRAAIRERMLRCIVREEPMTIDDQRGETEFTIRRS